MTKPEPLLPYDERALLELWAWSNPKSTRVNRLGDYVEVRIANVVDHLPTGLVDSVVARVMPMLGDVAKYGTSPALVVRAYRNEGLAVSSVTDIAGLHLQVADRVAGDRRLREAGVAGTEGAAAGAFGGLMLAADVAAVILLSMRAVQSRGLAYGFDPAGDAEAAFVLEVLDAATRLGPRGKSAARTGLSSWGKRVIGREGVQTAVEALMKGLPAKLAAILTTMKSESVVPIFGSATSGSFNAWYLARVTETARMAYRERFLRRRYGDEVLSVYGL